MEFYSIRWRLGESERKNIQKQMNFYDLSYQWYRFEIGIGLWYICQLYCFCFKLFFFFFGYVQYNFAGKIGAISEWADKFRQKSRNIYFLTKELFENGNIKYKIFCEKSPHNCHTFVLNNYLFIDNCAAISHVDRLSLLLFLCFLSFLFETIFWLTFLKLNYS